MSMDVCDCGRVIEQPARGRPRTKCLICSPRENRKSRAPVLQLPVRELDPDSGLTGATRRALEEWGMLDDWRGVVCLKLSELVDSGRMGASGPAGTVKALRESMSYALEHSAADKDADVIHAIFAAKD